MKQAELTREQLSILVDAADRCDLEFRTDYSGRGMYGEQCIGVVGYLSDLLAFVLLVAEQDKDLAQDELTQLTWDSMGLSTIYYWPKLAVARKGTEDDQR